MCADQACFSLSYKKVTQQNYNCLMQNHQHYNKTSNTSQDSNKHLLPKTPVTT